jgi:hypothetical protein
VWESAEGLQPQLGATTVFMDEHGQMLALTNPLDD